ncbi:MAG TPA: TIGR01777 family oxidoreductase [Pyrinomonadaceae bacterium]|nr:TIGR01777 family oxidoreductase [Pyrinomonadaceae bacterium]
MKIVVTGATGLVGSALVPSLLADGHSVVRLVRRQSNAGAGGNVTDAVWQPDRGEIDAGALAGCDAAVHLAGENISEGRWTEEKKRRIIESREKGTRLISETLARLTPLPRVLVSASATGFYGDRGDEVLTEESTSGRNFVAEVCREWEAATEPARAAGIRTVMLRFGIVLSREGGALQKMMTPIKLGVGGKLGSGRQYYSWITIDDAVAAIRHALVDESVSGPVNAVSPQPVTNAEFTKALGRALGRPTLFAVPAFAARLAFGEMADELLLASARVEPARLKATGFEFKHPTLEGALRDLVGG